MHKLRTLIKQVNRTHKGLGQMIAINLLAAKAKKAILNVSPAGCGSTEATVRKKCPFKKHGTKTDWRLTV